MRKKVIVEKVENLVPVWKAVRDISWQRDQKRKEAGGVNTAKGYTLAEMRKMGIL